MTDYMDRISDGVSSDVAIANGSVTNIVVARTGWREASHVDVATVCISVSEIIFQAIQPDSGPTVYVIPDETGPIVLFERGPNGEYFILLDLKDGYWSQLAYQFAHEMGHVLCSAISRKRPQVWFEEAFCESLSLWTLDKAATTWKTNPPYSNWRGYAPKLASYATNIRARVEQPKSITTWFQQHQDYLSQERYDRDKNLVVAKELSALAHQHPLFYQAFHYLQRNELGASASMQDLLDQWTRDCPDMLRFAPETVGALLGVDT